MSTKTIHIDGKSIHRNVSIAVGHTSVGKPATRLDGEPKVTGAINYTADLVLPGMIWGKCLRSPLPHARITQIDVSDAKKLKGVLAVLSGTDLSQKLIGRRLKDVPVLAQGKVRFIGEKVAVVGAETPEIAEEALARIKVEYEELETVYDPLEAMAAGAPDLHENLLTYENLRLPLPDIPNVHSHVQWHIGNLDQGFAKSDHVYEQTFSTQRVHHGYLEPHAVVVAVDSAARILVWSPAKGPHMARQQLAEWLGLDEAKIVFQVSPIGGDFGGKGSLMDIPVCYYLAKITGRPVKMIMDYSEELIAANPRHPSIITIRTGVSKDGKLLAREVRAIFNSGAYAGFKNNETINLPGARHGAGAYHIPNVRIDAFSVYTNCVPSGIMRGPGEAQMIFAVESHTDHIAKELNLDPYEFRRLNVLKRGNLLPHGVALQSNKGKQLLEQLASNFKWNTKRSKRPYVGRGLALCMREIGVGEANVEVGIKEGGIAYILTTIPETGTGSHTIFRQIVGEIVGISSDAIEVILGTTDSFATDVAVAASRVTCLGGQATRVAALELRDILIKEAAQCLGCSLNSVKITPAGIFGLKQRKISLSELASRALLSGRTLSAKGNFKLQERTGAACFFAQAAEVKVDPETGKVEILRILSAYDVGTVINPLAHQGQLEGGMIQGFGFALMEDLISDEGRIVTSNLGEYKLPNIMDIPMHKTILLQDQDGPGPFQSKPIGEHSAVPTAPAIANAVYDAIGVQITDLPLTAEKVYFALQRNRETLNAMLGGSSAVTEKYAGVYSSA